MANEPNLERILLIEDNQQHLQDAKTVLDKRVAAGALGAVDYVSTYDDAMRTLQERHYDGILSDLFFPQRDGGVEEAYGRTIAQYALDNRLPVVLVTDTHHHGKKTEAHAQWANMNGVFLYDANRGGDGFTVPRKSDGNWDLDGRAQRKCWQSAYIRMAELLHLAKQPHAAPDSSVELDALKDTYLRGIEDLYGYVCDERPE